MRCTITPFIRRLYMLDCTSDSPGLRSNLAEIARNTGRNPVKITADRGYNDKSHLRELEERGIDGYIPQPQRIKDQRDGFSYDTNSDTYTCRDGRILRFKSKLGTTHRRYQSVGCDGCKHQSECITRQGGTRKYLGIHNDETIFQRMVTKCATPEGLAMKVRRSKTVELVFGDIKFNKGLRQFLVRGKDMVNSMWRFTLATFNIQRLISYRQAIAQ
jgi:hypothetical protein